MKIARLENPVNPGQPIPAPGAQWLFECPGCGNSHGFRSEGQPPVWQFNGDMDRPTLSPSILCQSHDANGPTRCHSFIRDGKIQFLSDCTHALAGQTVELPEIE